MPTQLARIGIRPDDIGRLAISHYHFDHVGQAATFPHAMLLIGAKDWAALHSGTIPFADSCHHATATSPEKDGISGKPR